MMRVLAEGLASQGHEVLVLLLFDVETPTTDGLGSVAQTLEKLRLMNVSYDVSVNGTIRFKHAGVEFAGVDLRSNRFLPFIETSLKAFAADAVIVTDIGGAVAHTVLRTVHDGFDGLLIYYPMTIHMLPGGPLALTLDHEASAVIKKSHVIVPSAFSAQYMSKHFGVSATVCIPPMFSVADERPPDVSARFGKPIGLFNPNDWKGLPILAGLAGRRPDIPFLVRCSWRTGRSELEQLRSYPNISVHTEPANKQGTIYEAISAVLAPSLCYESLGLVPIEAMLKGVPAVSSSHGGLREAALGVPFSLDVNPIVFHRDISEPHLPARQVVPEEQPFDQWIEAINSLWSDKIFYQELALKAWRRANDFARSLTWKQVENAMLR